MGKDDTRQTRAEPRAKASVFIFFNTLLRLNPDISRASFLILGIYPASIGITIWNVWNKNGGQKRRQGIKKINILEKTSDKLDMPIKVTNTHINIKAAEFTRSFVFNQHYKLCYGRLES